VADLTLSLTEARRLAVRGQHRAGPPPAAGIDGMRQVLRGLRVLQLDPVNVVARSHLLVLWSRLGAFDQDDLETLLWRDRWLFEYWAHSASIVLTEDYPIHHVMMRDFTETIESPQRRAWMAANTDFRRYILDTLWKQGLVTVAGRGGLKRLWGLAVFPEMGEELPQAEAVTRTGTCSASSTRNGTLVPRCCRRSTTSFVTASGPSGSGASSTATRCTCPGSSGSSAATSCLCYPENA
jgi:uncharacterized protein YcaQ